MSHVRNLFQKSLLDPYAPAAAPMVAGAPADTTVVGPSTTPECPSVEVMVRPEHRLVFHTDPRGPAADRYRLVRMRLRDLWNAGRVKTVLVTSALPREGKSTVVLNLATALAEQGKRSVLVIEADLHRSGLSKTLGLTPWAGLTDCLMDECVNPFSGIRRVEPLGWHLLPAGEPHRNPTELLQTPVIGSVLDRVSAAFDWVVIDSPPTIPLTDAMSLQQYADGTLMVVRAGHSPRQAVEHAMEILGKKKILGLILNGVEQRNSLHYQYRRYDEYSKDPQS